MVFLNGPCIALFYGVIIAMTATLAAALRASSAAASDGSSVTKLKRGGGLLISPVITASTSGEVTCEVARLKCAYRMGCGMALQNYLVGCADVMSGRIKRCSDLCKKALIALTSTEEGQNLMKCDCEGQEFCEETKQRVEVCRPEVMRANEENSVVSCSVAQWICMADPLCSTAVEYYRRLCRSMFQGRKCTMRCNNSIAILNRQEKAAKLKTCMCDGTEDYDCQNIKLNMDRLCFHRNYHNNNNNHDLHNEIQLRDSPDGTAHGDHRHNTGDLKNIYSSGTATEKKFLLYSLTSSMLYITFITLIQSYVILLR
ncbi:hypothetical protein CHUAL_006964 [Chamberlinius hualienensis]